MVRVLYVGGLGRGGSTRLERVLGELPGICPLGQVSHLWQRDLREDQRCGCGRRFSGCEFWQRVGEAAFGGWDRLDLQRVLAVRDLVERTRHIPRLAASRLSADRRALVVEYAGYYARVYRAAAEVSGSSVVIDSSKHGALAYCLRWATGVDLRVVHMVRDSRGVADSWTRSVPRPESYAAPSMTRYPPGRSAPPWNAHDAAFGLLARHGVPVRRVRREEFLADPVGTVRLLAEFAGLAPGEPDLAFLTADSAVLGPFHGAAGNPMRFTLGEMPLHTDEAWRGAVPTGQRKLVGVLTAPLPGAYGYRPSGRRP